MAEYIFPKHWQIKKLGEVCDKISLNGIKIKQKDYLEIGKFPVVDQGQAIIGGYSNEEKLIVPGEPPYIIFGDHTKVKKYINFKFIAGADGVKVLKPCSVFDPKFFFYLIQTTKIPDKGYARHFQFLEKAEIPIPPHKEQLTIVSKIEELLSDLENGKQQLILAQQQLKVYRQSLLKAAFEGKLTNKNINGELPEGWKIVKSGEIIDIINNGYTPTKEHLSDGSGEIPFIKVYNLKFDGTLNFRKNPTFIPNTIHKKELKRSICFPGDVLINIVGPPLGKVSVVSNQFPEWNINQAIVMFRPNEKILSKYISYFLQNPVTINWLEDTSKATAGQWNVKVSTCRLIHIPVPPINEQQHIVDELESKLTVCDKIEETINQSLQQAETLRQSILKKAFEGKLI
jgi:type I restriction enzyme S subunit